MRDRPRLREHPGFIAFWTASTISDVGSALTGLALQTLVLTRLGGTNADVGLVSSARWIAYAAVGLVAGLWLDRVRRRPVLISTDLGQGIVLGVVAVLGLTGVLRVWSLAVLMIVFGLLALFNDAAYQAITPRLVPRRLLTRANTRLQQSTAVAQTGGPALAGVLIKIVGAPVAIGIDAVSYLLSAAVMTRLPDETPVDPSTGSGNETSPEPTAARSPEPTTPARSPEPATPARSPEPVEGSFRAEIAEGLRWIYTHRLLGPLTINTHLWFVCWSGLNTIMVAFALRRLGLDVLTIGICFALGSVAALVTTTASEPFSDRWGVGRTIAVSRLVYIPGVVVLLLAPAAGHGPGWLAVGCFGLAQVVIGCAFGLEGPAEISFRQAVTPDRLQGRTNATGRSANRTMIVIAAPLAGLLADRAGYPVALSVIAAGFVLVAATFVLSPTRTAVLPADPVP